MKKVKTMFKMAIVSIASLFATLSCETIEMEDMAGVWRRDSKFEYNHKQEVYFLDSYNCHTGSVKFIDDDKVTENKLTYNVRDGYLLVKLDNAFKYAVPIEAESEFEKCSRFKDGYYIVRDFFLLQKVHPNYYDNFVI